MAKMAAMSNANRKFSIGDKVRVRPGMTDPDVPEMPLGGWAGEITEIGDESLCLYLVKWSQETLSSIHPVLRNRSIGHGLDFEHMWLAEADLVPDSGGPLMIEQPTKVEPRPLSQDDDIDRIRMAFGLTTDELLPQVNAESSAKYYKYLATRLEFPFEARWIRDFSAFKHGNVTVLKFFTDDGTVAKIDDKYGLLCEAMLGKRRLALPLAEIEDVQGEPNCLLVDDYAVWFLNWQ